MPAMSDSARDSTVGKIEIRLEKKNGLKHLNKALINSKLKVFKDFSIFN